MRGRRREFRNLETPVSQGDLLEAGRCAAEARRRVVELEADKKSFDERMKGLIAEQHQKMIAELAIFEAGHRLETVECEVRYHEPAKGKKTVIRLDRGEAVSIEPMSDAELGDTEPLPGTSTVLRGIADGLRAVDGEVSLSAITEAFAEVYLRQSERELAGWYVYADIGLAGMVEFDYADDLLRAARANVLIVSVLDPRTCTPTALYSRLADGFSEHYEADEAKRAAASVADWMMELRLTDFDALLVEWVRGDADRWQAEAIQAARRNNTRDGTSVREIAEECDTSEETALDMARLVWGRWEGITKIKAPRDVVDEWLAKSWPYGADALRDEFTRTNDDGSLRKEWLRKHGYLAEPADASKEEANDAPTSDEPKPEDAKPEDTDSGSDLPGEEQDAA
jgi:hypothetical protein